MPQTTQGFFAISNVDVLEKHWDKTQLGHLMADPVMKPFTRDMKRQVEERWSSVEDRLGLTLDDMKGVPGGDVGIGLIAPKAGAAAVAIVIDVTGKLPQAREMLRRVNKRQLQRGAKRTELKIKGCPDAVIQYDLPESEDDKDARESTLQGSQKAQPANNARATPTRQAFYCLTGNLIVVADNLEIATAVLGRAIGFHKEKDSLADHKPFQEVMKRCKSDYGPGTPQMRWFVHPLGYAEAARAATPDSRRRKGKTFLEVMRHQGVGAVQGIGGLVDFSEEGYELVHRTAVFAPPPYEKAMKMAVLPNQKDFSPQPWVPRELATYTTLYFDIINGFDNFGPLFDELFGQGEEGTWLEAMESLEKDPSGPQVNIREDLVMHLGQRISMMSDYEVPITTKSDRLLIAIEAKEPKPVASAIRKLLKNDPDWRCRKEKGLEIWEMVQEETPGLAPPVIEDGSGFGDERQMTRHHPLRKHRGEEEEEARKPLLPHAAITVWNGHLMVASHIDFLLKVVAPDKKKQKPLSGEADYRAVQQQITKFKPQEKCVQFFSRTDEEYRPTYEMVRQNRLPESESLFAKSLNALFGQGKKGTRAPKIDGTQLPEYKAVSPYLGPAGLRATSEPTGWYLKGFTLTKETKAGK
ncbi:MAG: hypothetical protein ABFC96_00455 [Thermoguttaceae bacterium]